MHVKGPLWWMTVQSLITAETTTWLLYLSLMGWCMQEPFSKFPFSHTVFVPVMQPQP